ncbi:hypothetical protein BJ170DRAFT_144708 [Xylariales sp. AK1849]|nr:hypothetical protein BJ170DRAFT_144708 [Xylariales sp. AK1849]
MHLPYRIPIPVRSSDNGLSKRGLAQRSPGGDDGKGPPNMSIIIIGICTGVVVLIICSWAVVRNRKSKSKKSRFSKRHGYRQTNGQDDSPRPSHTRQVPPNFDAAVSETTRNRDCTTSNVDRNTSVRSVMTLPPYRFRPNDTEQVLGREGERGGVDVVVEMPTVDDDEELREEEMEAAYQIRLARRQELAERDERRRLRREARARGDTVALSELSARARAASQSNSVNDLREEHQRIKNQRQRAVSSVSYAELGVARHDGTRLRANSQESERMGLLSDAASIALSARSPSSMSMSTHRRDRSASSVLSFDSTQDFPSPGLPRSGATTPRRLSAQHTGGATAGSSPEIIGEADLGDTEMPPHSPPGYDDVSLDDVGRSGATTPLFNEPPPDYPGPAQARDRKLGSHIAHMMGSVGDDGDLSDRRSSQTSTRDSLRSSRGDSIPRLPSLRIASLPQIVVQPSSAHPRDTSRDR